MGILTILFFIILALTVFNFYIIGKKDFKDILEARKKLIYIKSIGLFAMVTGILHQLIGLFMAFKALELAGDVSLSLLASGLKISLISPIYGIMIFLLSYLLWITLDYLASRNI